ncbi:MAG: LemA family protein [Anaerovoracaceae bacterium]|jgi:LemA protein|nr:LemA family protein [Bacillota bacterium]
MEFLIGLIVVLAVVAIWGVSAYNGFVRMRNVVEEAFSTMDVYMKKRYDLIPNLVETVKGYAAHEQGTFEKVVQARNVAQNATTVEDKMAAENMLTGTLKSLFALAEAYPDLKANANFMDLQNQLQMVEVDIANSRKYYNATVKDYNTKTEQFPSNIIANMFHFQRKTMFELENESERQNVKVEF